MWGHVRPRNSAESTWDWERRKMCHVPTTPWQHLCCSIRSPQCLLQALTSTKGRKTLEDYEPLTKHKQKQLPASQNGNLVTRSSWNPCLYSLFQWEHRDRINHGLVMNVWCSQDLRHLCAKRNLISGMSYAGLVLISEEPKNVSQEACSLSVAVAESLFLSAFGPPREHCLPWVQAAKNECQRFENNQHAIK